MPHRNRSRHHFFSSYSFGTAFSFFLPLPVTKQWRRKVTRKLLGYGYAALLASLPLLSTLDRAHAQAQKPNIILILSDDFGYGDSGPYGGGENRGMPTPSLDRLASEGMTFLSFMLSRVARPVAQPCKPVAFRTVVA
jgi:hypothetical protein